MVAQHTASGSRRSGRVLLLATAALLVAAGLPFLLNSFFVGVVTSVLIWTIIGLGMVVLLGYSGQVSIGHSAFLAIGAYGHALLIGAGVPFLLSVPIVVVACLVVGALIALPSLRFSGVYLAMATLAFAFIVEAVIGDLEITGGRGGMPVPREKLFGYSLTQTNVLFYATLVLLVGTFLIARNLVRSRTGRAWASLRDSEVAAASMGVGIARYKTYAFAFSAATTALAGTLLAHKVGYLSPDGFTIQQSIEMLILVVIGGMGSLAGAFYGAAFLIILPVLLSIVKDNVPSGMGELPGLEAGILGAALIVFILFQPKGIDGAIRAVLARLKNGSGTGGNDHAGA